MIIDLKSTFFQECGFTEIEAQIAAEVLQGKRQGDIAHKQGVLLEDIARQMEGVRFKAGVQSRGRNHPRALLKLALEGGLKIEIDRDEYDRFYRSVNQTQRDILLGVALGKANNILRAEFSLSAYALDLRFRAAEQKLRARDVVHASLMVVSGVIARNGGTHQNWPLTRVSVSDLAR